MSKTWPLVKLGEVLEKSQNWINLDAQEEYKEVTVRLWGKGVTLRGIVTGSQIAGSRRLQVHSTQFILSRIDARNGAFGLIPDELDNAIVSNDFPVFDIHQNRLLPKYLHWLSKTKNFVESCKSVSEGTTNRVRLKEEKFIQIEIPLPSLTEQQRIVAKIERLARKIEDAKSLQDKSMLGSDYFLFSSIGDTFKKVESTEKIVSFGELDPHITSGPRNWNQYYKFEGYRFYRAQDIGLKGEILDKDKQFLEPPPGNQGRSAQLQVGDLMIVITGATVGRVTIFTKDKEPGFVSQHVSICRLSKDRINPKYALWGLRGPKGQEQLINQRYGQGKPGLNLTNISNLKLPLPSLAEQYRIAEKLDKLQEKLDVIKNLQAKTIAELDAILPSILDKAFKGEL